MICLHLLYLYRFIWSWLEVVTITTTNSDTCSTVDTISKPVPHYATKRIFNNKTILNNEFTCIFKVLLHVAVDKIISFIEFVSL